MLDFKAVQMRFLKLILLLWSQAKLPKIFSDIVIVKQEGGKKKKKKQSHT